MLLSEPRLRSARLQVDIERYRHRQTRAGLLPSLSLRGTSEHVKESERHVFRDSYHPTKVSLQFSTPLLDPTARLNWEAGRMEEEEAQLGSKSQPKMFSKT